MNSFSLPFTGLVAPLDRENVDTDAIIPKQFLKSTVRTGYGNHLFDAWRFKDDGELGMPVADRRPNSEFVLNLPRYQNASVLLARKNFGCGSSREHAPWALNQYGFRAVVATSFGDIFRNNALKNGLIVIALPEDKIDALFQAVEASPGYTLTIDLSGQKMVSPDGKNLTFDIDPFRKRCLIDGIDEISLALSFDASIKLYEKQAAALQPWLFQG